MMDRILAMIRSARIKLIDDTDVIQRAQVDEGPIAPSGDRRIIDRVKMVGLFGFSSNPPVDTEVLVLGIAGDRSRSIGIGTNHQPSRPTGLQPGDSGIYDVREAFVRLTADGLIIDGAGLPAVIRNVASLTVTSAGTVTIDAPAVAIEHDLTVGGNITAQGNVTAEGGINAQGNVSAEGAIYGRGGATELNALHDTFNGHHHGGVQTGSGTSGGPSPTV